MAPPCFLDLGKEVKDVLSMGFPLGTIGLGLKTKTASGLEISSTGVRNHESQKVFGDVEGKYVLDDYRATILTKWHTNNILSSKFEFQEIGVKGLNVGMETLVHIPAGTKDGKIDFEYNTDQLNVSGDVDLNLSGPIVQGSAVLTQGNWFAGYSMGYDSAKAKLIKNNFNIGRTAADFLFMLNSTDGKSFGGSLFKKVSDKVCCACSCVWTAPTNTSTLTIGTKIELDEDVCFRAKINNSRNITLSYGQKLRDGVFFTIATQIEGRRLNQGGHKIGFSLELEA